MEKELLNEFVYLPVSCTYYVRICAFFSIGYVENKQAKFLH